MEDSSGEPVASLQQQPAQGEEEGKEEPAEVQSEEKKEHDEHAKMRSQGEEAFKEGKFLSAIEFFTQALRLLPDTNSAEALDILTNRSTAYSSLSRQYLSRPANRSECAALYGPDPGCLNARAVADAQKVLAARPQWPKAHAIMGTALLLSEKYEDARQSFKAGLKLAPGNAACKEGLKAVAQATEEEDEEEEGEEEKGAMQEGHEGGHAKRPEAGRESEQGGAGCSHSPPSTSKRARMMSRALSEQAADECECTLCLKLLFEPVTTPCGHSFCRGCLMRALDHRSRCPVCRTVLHIGNGQLPVTVVLQKILQRTFPEEYAERSKEEAVAVQQHQQQFGNSVKLPLFVMSTIMPGEFIALNIFEPRYRLLLRRAMEGNRRLGMAEVSLDGELQDVAVEAEVTEYTPQPDGRYFVELVGRRRVKIQHCHELDGYRVATASVIERDEYPPEGSPEAEALHKKATEVLHHILKLLERLSEWAARSLGRAGRIQELVARAGPRPSEASLRTPQGAEQLSFWAGAFASTVALGMDRCKLLKTTNTMERLNIILDLI